MIQVGGFVLDVVSRPHQSSVVGSFLLRAVGTRAGLPFLCGSGATVHEAIRPEARLRALYMSFTPILPTSLSLPPTRYHSTFMWCAVCSCAPVRGDHFTGARARSARVWSGALRGAAVRARPAARFRRSRVLPRPRRRARTPHQQPQQPPSSHCSSSSSSSSSSNSSHSSSHSSSNKSSSAFSADVGRSRSVVSELRNRAKIV